MDIENGQVFIDPFTGEQAFAVDPITNCPHALQLDYSETKEVVTSKSTGLFLSPCDECKNIGENWICLHCNKIFCSRYVQGHMASHNADNQDHAVALSFSDLSFWCYSCDSYIINQDLVGIRKLFQQAKFAKEAPAPKKQVNKIDVDTEIDQLAQGKGFFVVGDISANNKIYETLIINDFVKQEFLQLEKGVLLGYKEAKNQQLEEGKPEDEVLGTALIFTPKADFETKRKIAFLINEIEGFPHSATLQYRPVQFSENLEKLAIYLDIIYD